MPNRQAVRGRCHQHDEPDWTGFRIAIVDDNFINQKILCKQLRTYLGLTVPPCDIFNNGKLLLDRLADTCYDLILLDIEMPVLDGMETCVRIRSGLPSPACSTDSSPSGLFLPPEVTEASECGLASPPASPSPYPHPNHHPHDEDDHTTDHLAVLPINRDIPIVAVTCNALDHQRKHYLDLGINSVVAKPLDPDLLIPTVKYHLRAARDLGRSEGARWPRLRLVSSATSLDGTSVRSSSPENDDNSNGLHPSYPGPTSRDPSLSRSASPAPSVILSQRGDGSSDRDADGWSVESVDASSGTSLSSSDSSRLLKVFDSVLQADGLARRGMRSERSPQGRRTKKGHVVQ
ncbi:hypothetical protein HKX48_000194 [Thoreauomyces humboldtii]|nr:hypothetical protein HKX48_000194 [Thoreauomyces humboldtii]